MVCSFSRVIQPFDMQSQSGQQHEEVLNKADPKKRCDWLGPSVSRKKHAGPYSCISKSEVGAWKFWPFVHRCLSQNSHIG